MDEAKRTYQQQIERLARTSLRRNLAFARRKQVLRDLASAVTADSSLPTPLLNKLMACWLAPAIDHESKTVSIGLLGQLDLPKNLDATPIKNLLFYDPIYYKEAGDLANSIRPDYVDALCRYAFANLGLTLHVEIPRLLEIAGDFLDPSSYPVLIACWRDLLKDAVLINEFVTDQLVAGGLTPPEAFGWFIGFVAQTRFIGTDAEFYGYVVRQLIVRCPLTSMKAEDLMDAIDMAGDYMVKDRVYAIAPFTSFHDFKISKIPDYLDLTVKALNRSVEELHIHMVTDSGSLDAELSDLEVTVSDEPPSQRSNPATDLYYHTRLTRLFYHIPARLKAKKESE